MFQCLRFGVPYVRSFGAGFYVSQNLHFQTSLAKLLKKTPLASVQKSVPRRSHGKSRFGEMASHLPLCREKQYPTVIQSRRLRGGSGESARKSLKIVHMSDTHGKFYDVPNGDVLIHSGDFTNHGIRDGLEELEAFVLLAALNG